MFAYERVGSFEHQLKMKGAQCKVPSTPPPRAVPRKGMVLDENGLARVFETDP